MKKNFKYLFVFCFSFILTSTFIANNHDEKHDKSNKHKHVQSVEKIEANEIKEEKLEVNKNELNYVDVWTNSYTYLKKEPNIESENVDCYHYNTKLCVVYINENWAKLKDTEYYIERNLLSEHELTFNDYSVPSNNKIKSYMDYRTITLETSNQYKLQINHAYTGGNGIRMVNGRYCVALGSYYTTAIGQYVDIMLENGAIIHGVLADCKSNQHTDSNNQIHSTDGSVVEFIIDNDYLNEYVMITGDVSNINGWDSKVVGIRVYDYVVE